MTAQNAPYLMPANIRQGFGQTISIPLGIAFGRWLIEQGQHPLFGRLVVAGRLARTCSVDQACQPMGAETLPPLKHAPSVVCKMIRDLLVGAPFISEQDYPRPLGHPIFGLALANPSLQSLHLLIGQGKRSGRLVHIAIMPQYANYCN